MREAHSFPSREYLCDGSHDYPSGTLALLTRQRSRHNGANVRPRFNELLTTQPPSHCDLHALREHPIHDVLQEALLIRNVERQHHGT